MVRSACVLFIVLPLIAGCVGPEVEQVPEDVIAATQAFQYACPPGQTITLSNGLCVTTFVDPRETFEEPYLAVHPSQPETMVLGMNAWHAEPRPTLVQGLPSLEVGRVALFVTQDAGATWTSVTSPPILYGTDQIGKTSYSGDPVLEFDSRGVLHYLQTSVSFDRPDPDAFPYLDIQYARSEDLGQTWSQNMLLADDGDNDRPWMTVHEETIFVTWRNIFAQKSPELAWSDDGQKWEVASGPPECSNGDRAIVRPEGVLFPCELKVDGTTTGLQINRFDPGTQTFERWSQVPTPAGWQPDVEAHVQWDQSADGSVVALATRQKDPSGFAAFSYDGGRTWAEPIPLVELCGCEPETGSVHTYGARFDAWGGFHIMLPDAYVEIPTNYDDRHVRYAAGERDIFHVVVDGQGDLIRQQKVFDGIEQDPRAQPSAGPPIGRDDYYIPAFWSDGGAIAWTRDKGIDLTWVVPEPNAGD